MILNENEKCPVCDKLFSENDDIVFCHHCGTPHHRECYNKTGHCINSDKHGTDFEYTIKQDNSSKSDNTTAKYNVNNEYYQPEDKAPDTQNDGNEALNDAGNDKTDTAFTSGENIRIRLEKVAYGKSQEKIDGKSVGEIACVINTNIERFIKKFRANRLFSWNWGAFFFGPYYLFFRKMSLQGFAFLALNYAVSFTVQGFYYEKLNNFYAFINDNFNKMNDILASPGSELAKEMDLLCREIMPAVVIIMAASLLINIAIAVFADKFYRKKVMSVIDKVNSNLEDGATFASPLPMIDDRQLSQQEMKNIYLSKLGGTSLMLPLMIYAVIMLLST